MTGIPDPLVAQILPSRLGESPPSLSEADERCCPPCASLPRPTDSTMDQPRRPSPDMDPLSLVGAAVLDALEFIDLPAYVIDRKGTLRWANKAVSRLIGDRVGHSFLSFVSSDSRQRVEAQFARKVVGGEATAYSFTVFDAAGRRACLRVHSAPLRRVDREIVGVFGLALSRESRRGNPTERPSRTFSSRRVKRRCCGYSARV